jgi:FkbM family methyltransferase
MDGREQKIYKLLQDDESRKLFAAMKRLAETNDRTAHMTDFGFSREAHELVDRLKREKYYIYGAGTTSKKLLTVLDYFDALKNCKGIWDSNDRLWGKKLSSGEMPVSLPYYAAGRQIQAEGRQILISRPPKSGARGDGLVLMGVSPLFGPFSEILNFAKGIGVAEEKIICPYFLLLAKDKQYFDDEIILSKLGNDEVFVDAGCLDFSTGQEFLRYCPNARKIYAFEPDEKQFEICRRKIAESGFRNATLQRAALWDCRATLTFSEGGQGNIGGGMVGDTAGDMITGIRAVAFDDAVDRSDKVTFVKMDIEGAEMNALRGMAKTIARDRPKLAICIYHRPLDYIDIPEYMHSLVPECKFYIRNYHIGMTETILYCVL